LDFNEFVHPDHKGLIEIDLKICYVLPLPNLSFAETKEVVNGLVILHQCRVVV